MITQIKKTFPLMLLALLISFQSCRTMKDKDPQPVDNGSAPTEVERISGTVKFTDECSYYIDVIQGDVMRSYKPVNLEEKYQVPGMRLKFAYVSANMESPKLCGNMIMISVSDVTPLR